MTPLVDTNVYVGPWPFRRLAGEDPRQLVAKLRAAGVTQAWTGSFQGVFHRDVAAANEMLAEVCRAHGRGLLVPFGSINPTLPDWRHDLDRCREKHDMPGVRLHPNYHGYTLDADAFQDVVAAAVERDLVVQLVVRMEDERTQHPMFRVPRLDCQPLAAVVRRHPRLRLTVLGALGALALADAADVAASGQVCFDIAMLEGVGGVRRLVDQIGSEHVVFGSHALLFYFESAALKLRESELGGLQREAIRAGNARRLLAT